MSHRGNLTIVQAFAYWTDCAVATLDVAVNRKGTSKADLKRFHSIALDMVTDLGYYNNSTASPTTPSDKDEYKRISERFSRADSAFTDVLRQAVAKRGVKQPVSQAE